MVRTVYELNVRYDARASFYGKARVHEMDNGDLILVSYSTEVAMIRGNKAYINGTYSQTTTRHQKEFLKQNGFKAENSKQMVKDYLINDDQWKALRGC